MLGEDIMVPRKDAGIAAVSFGLLVELAMNLKRLA
jgi:hypothetical protein